MLPLPALLLFTLLLAPEPEADNEPCIDTPPPTIPNPLDVIPIETGE
jgi:hypothetical protein